jgi:hypothetical protein
VLEVKELLDRWIEEEADCFELVADDGNKYVLKYDRQEDSWELSMHSAPAHSEGKVIHLDQARKTKPGGTRRT